VEAALFAESVPGYERSFGGRSDQLPEGLGQMVSVVQEEHPPRAPLHQERDQRGVRLGRVTATAGENQIVRPVVGRLTPSGTHVVQGDRVISGLGAAIRANGTMLGEQPIAM
jgi:hypothetical protein